MNVKPGIMVSNRSTVFNLISWIFGIAAFAAGLVNTGWGNDPGFGAFIILASFVYFPPANVMFNRVAGISIPAIVKILLAIFIVIATLGVGELSDKIDLMMMDLFPG